MNRLIRAEAAFALMPKRGAMSLGIVVSEERVQVRNLLRWKLGLQKRHEFLAIDGLEGISPRVGNSLQ